MIEIEKEGPFEPTRIVEPGEYIEPKKYYYRYYICKGYPCWNPMYRSEGTTPKEISAFRDERREKNWKAIEPQWNIFIEQLKKEGRYRE